MTAFTINDTPADIVKIYPKASDLFKKNRIDFCCGGDKPLVDFFTKRNITGEEILTELNTSFDDWKSKGNTAVDWDSITYSDLVDHIVFTHHGYLKEELPALAQFITKIFRVHGGKHPELVLLHKLYYNFQMDMEVHMEREERELFPLIKQYDLDPTPALLERIVKVNSLLEADHDSTGEMLKKMHDITNGFEPPLNACNSYRITFARLKELESDTFQHIHLENNILFRNLV